MVTGLLRGQRRACQRAEHPSIVCFHGKTAADTLAVLAGQLLTSSCKYNAKDGGEEKRGSLKAKTDALLFYAVYNHNGGGTFFEDFF